MKTLGRMSASLPQRSVFALVDDARRDILETAAALGMRVPITRVSSSFQSSMRPINTTVSAKRWGSQPSMTK